MIKNKIKATHIGLILLVFGGLFASISLVNHYNFRTYGFDLGIFNQAAFDYSKFDLNTNTVLNPTTDNLLSDHMCLILIPISFLRYIFGTYALLVAQIIAVLLGGLGCYKAIEFKTKSHGLSLLAMVHFLSYLGVFTALSFDYHNNVIAAALVPWFYYFIFKKKWAWGLVFALLIISCKENLAIYMALIAVGLLLTYKTDVVTKRVLIFISIFGVIYFGAVVGYIIPWLDNDGIAYNHFHYGILGESWSEGIKNIISNPLKYLKLLFTSHHHDPYYEGLKLKSWFVFAISGGIVAVVNPRFLLVVGFIFVQKMFNDGPEKWGIGAQYTVVLTPLITIALFQAISVLKKDALKWSLAILSVITIMATTLYCIEYDNLSFMDKNRIKFYEETHYRNDFMNNKVIYEKLTLIPEEASVSAEGNILPHLALREKIYTFPTVSDADYIVLLPNDHFTYPLERDDFLSRVESYRENQDWRIEYEGVDLLIFKRKNL